MSDSFADLWSSSTSKPKPQTLASSSSKANSKTDAFSLLANAAQQPRFGSPNLAPAKRSTSSTPVPPPSRGATTTGSDAFSDLFSSKASAANANGMTIAERLAMETRAKGSRRVREENQPRQNPDSQDSAWAGLDLLVPSGAGTSSTRTRSLTDSDDWGLSDFSSSTASTAKTTTTLPSTLSQPQPQKSLKPATLWDLEDFTSPSSSAHPSRPSSQNKVRKPSQLNSSQNVESSGSNFDFDDVDHPRNDSRAGTRLLDLDHDAADIDFGMGEWNEDVPRQDHNSIGNRGTSNDDDILGMLSQPVEVVKARNPAQNLPPSQKVSRQSSFDDHLPSTNRKSAPQSRSSSPPPHILGQIVEMGFSVEQAKKALANTKDGKDVPAALEILLGGVGGSNSRQDDPSNQQGVETVQELRPTARRGPPKGFKERERERRDRVRRDREQEPGTPPGGSDVVTDMQEQADRLLSQASEIGLSVLSKASAFWKEKKDRVVKVYEERAVTSTTGPKERDGMPKWMKEGGVVGRVDDNEGDHPKTRERRMPSQDSEQRFQQEDKFIEPNLELDSLRPPKPGSIHQSRRTSTPSSQDANRETRTPFRLPTRDRPLPTASPSTLSTVDKHRTAGTSQFKLGQYASAVESYSAAISNLPPRHLLLLPLLNNRALARMRTGEYKAAADDAALALGIVLLHDGAGSLNEFDPNAKESLVPVTASSWLPSMEPPFLLTAAQQKANNGGWAHHQGVGVDLADGYIKALRRRAEASEGRERWSEALKFWEVLSAGDSALVEEHLRKEVQRSAARCRKLIADGNLGEEAPKLKPRPPVTKTKPNPAASLGSSAALRSLQASNAQAEAEDNLKHQLKDSVDSKLTAWRNGKETNIRALLASLDTVLWEELLKGVRVGGLHELVTPAQVKKGYMKAIARVHPDKLNAQNSTVEQRMLANGVFATLSEAWVSFQSSNGV